MMIDARSLPEGEEITGDLCIVGAGAAGIALALALADAPFRIVLLESGGLQLDGASQQLNDGENIGLPYFPLLGTRLRSFGGTTNHWGGTCRPFDEFDFRPIPGVPHTAWPITLADISPYYERATEICRLQATTWDSDAWIAASRFSALPLDRTMIETRVAQIVEGERRSFATAYRDDIDRAPRITTYLHANVVEIRLDPAGTAVSDLVVSTGPARTLSVVAQTYILATGGIENPRLLLASNRQHPAGVGNGEDQVGRYFLEHPRFTGGVIHGVGERVTTGLYQAHASDRKRLIGYLAVTRQLQEEEGLVDVQFRLRPRFRAAAERARRSADADAFRRLLNRVRRGSDAGDLGRDFATVLEDVTSWRRLLVPGTPFPSLQPDLMRIVGDATPDQLDALIPEFFGDIAVLAYGELTLSSAIEEIELSARIDPAPNPDSRVTLGSNRDAHGMPKVRLDWQLSRIDHHSVRRSLELLGRELGRAELGRVQIRLPDDEETWPDDLAGGYHHMGTTRMSGSPRDGVVDADCRVHGMSNLFVAGSSVFATGGSATPTLTLVALALRLADHVRGVLG